MLSNLSKQHMGCFGAALAAFFNEGFLEVCCVAVDEDLHEAVVLDALSEGYIILLDGLVPFLPVTSKHLFIVVVTAFLFVKMLKPMEVSYNFLLQVSQTGPLKMTAALLSS